VQHLKRIFDQVVFPFENVKNGNMDASGFLTESVRQFGSKRSNGTRAHAGVDLYAPPNTKILAVKDGVITDHREYLNPDNASVQNTVYALTVDHYDYVVRYCEIGDEIGSLPGELKVGSTVKTGQVIANVGEIIWDSGNTQSMLHFEMYDPGIAKGPWYANAANSELCSFSNNQPFFRSKKLRNPTEFLRKLL
jgi:murein DD-endopeptidase MepM/ murein hydrolase activator NlpD